jgi:hypothetical protein
MEDHSQSTCGRGTSASDSGGAASPINGELRPGARRPPLPSTTTSSERFEPPVSALGPLFRHRLERIHTCRVAYALDVNARPTLRVLGGYYRSRRLVRVYSHDRALGRRPLEELFDTFLHEVAHHLEYTEPYSFGSRGCRRVPGLMHSRLFWRILSRLKWRWAELKTRHSGHQSIKC